MDKRNLWILVGVWALAVAVFLAPIAAIGAGGSTSLFFHANATGTDTALQADHAGTGNLMSLQQNSVEKVAVANDGTATFAVIPEGPAQDPTTANQLARKQYVDDEVASAAASTNLGDLADVNQAGTPADNEVLAYDSTGGEWQNQTPGEAGLAPASHTHDTSEVVSGELPDARVSDTITVGASGSVANGALDPSVSLLGQTIEGSEITDATVDTADLAAGAVTVAKLSDFEPTDGGGLTLNVAAGRIRDDNVITDIGAATPTMTDATTNYVEIDVSAGSIVSNTSGFTSGDIAVATVVTAGGSISTITDKRAWLATGGGGGGGSTFIGHSDTPASYSGEAGKFPRVNGTPDALEFVATIPESAGGTGADNSGETGYQHYNGGTGEVIKTNYTATTDPGVNDDSSAGYSIGSPWVNKTTDTVWWCADASVGAAVWKDLSGAGTETDPTLTDDQLVTIGDGTANPQDLKADGDGSNDGTLRWDPSVNRWQPQNEVEFASGIPLSVAYTEAPNNGIGDFEDFTDNTSTYPAGWTQNDAAAGVRTNVPFDFWLLWGSSADGTWKYSQQRSKNLESQGANNWVSYIIGPVYWDDAHWANDTTDYYLGQHANNAGSPSTTIYARAHLQWDATGQQWRVRGEIKDGTTESTGSWYTFAFPYAQPVWFRIATKNAGTKECHVYMSVTPPYFQFAWFLLHSNTPAQTWGQVWSVFQMSRGTTDSDLNRIWIGQVQDAGNAS